MSVTNVNMMHPQTDADEDIVQGILDDQFTYHPWTEAQVQAGHQVRNALQSASFVIIKNVPPSADRSAALRKLREARMDANSAITHGGKY